MTMDDEIAKKDNFLYLLSLISLHPTIPASSHEEIEEELSSQFF